MPCSTIFHPYIHFHQLMPFQMHRSLPTPMGMVLIFQLVLMTLLLIACVTRVMIGVTLWGVVPL
jgi:hypothetical protein